MRVAWQLCIYSLINLTLYSKAQGRDRGASSLLTETEVVLRTVQCALITVLKTNNPFRLITAENIIEHNTNPADTKTNGILILFGKN